MSNPLHVLIVEDSEDDAALLLRELQRGGYEPIYERVENTAAMKAALARQRWDVVLADFTMPHFSVPAALALLKESRIDLPFIIVSGTVGEEAAVAAMKAGAHDYLSKGNLIRLTPAIERELREAESRRQRRQAEQALLDRERLFRALIENATDVVSLIDATGLIGYTSPGITRVLGYTPEEYAGLNAFDLLHPDDQPAQRALFQQLLGQPYGKITTQVRFRHKDGSWRWLEAVGTNLLAEPGVQAIVINFHDITERKQAEEALRQSETRFRALIEYAPDGITLLSAEGRLQYVRIYHRHSSQWRGSGEAGLPNTPDLILMDLVMPGLDGFEAIRQIRQTLASDYIPIIAVSANANGNIHQLGRTAGADDFLAKPVQFDDLVACLGTHLKLE